MKKMLPERIIRTTEQPLDEIDRNELVKKRNKQFVFLVTSYLPLVLVLAVIVSMGTSSLYHFRPHRINDEQQSNFDLAAPFVCGFFFLLLNIFFIRYYLQSLAPLIRDIKGGKKLLLDIVTEKHDMSLFDKYFLTTPIRKKQQVRIDRDDFNSIGLDAVLVLEIAPHSETVLRLTNKGREISFYG